MLLVGCNYLFILYVRQVNQVVLSPAQGPQGQRRHNAGARHDEAFHTRILGRWITGTSAKLNEVPGEFGQGER